MTAQAARDLAEDPLDRPAQEDQDRPRVSIIMPCYNVGDTLRRAVESILMQVVDFPYEIIMVNDASSDDTLAVMREYAAQHANIRVLANDHNLKNAKTFAKGLKAARGDYFGVLDGDDYYTNRHKLQRQVDFLDQDIRQEYVGTAHYFVVDAGDGTVNFDPLRKVDEFTYIDFLNGTHGYYHTSTYLYRNIFRGSPLELFEREEFRGDTPRTLFHLKFSNKKIKVLRFVGSAYSFTGLGIWSSLTEQEQTKYQINLYRNFGKVLESAFEQRWVERKIAQYEGALGAATARRREYPTRSLVSCLTQAAKAGVTFTNKERDYVFRGAYYSEYLDTAVSTIGEVFRIHCPEAAPVGCDPDSICVVSSYLAPRGGGIFREIKELIQLYPDKRVTVIVTRQTEPDEEAVRLLSALGNATVVHPNDGTDAVIERLHHAFATAAPSKAYFFLHHFDTFGATLIQRGECKNIVPFSFDHGFLAAIANPNVDQIIAKRPIDFHMLRSRFGDRVAYIPTANHPAQTTSRVYEPFRKHSNLVTASGAARFYKLGGPGEASYLDLVIALLKRTNGVHYHLGEIPDDADRDISARLAEAGLGDHQFVRLGWVENVADAMLENDVDIFIEPFPTVSYKLTLDLYSAGVPVFSRFGLGRMGTVDFTYPGNLTWRDPEEFLSTLSTLDAPTLRTHSKLSREYFMETHNYEGLRDSLRADSPLPPPPPVRCLDAQLHDIFDFAGLFPQEAPISITPQYRLPKAAPVKASATSAADAVAAARREAAAKAKRVAGRAKVDKRIRDIERSISYRLGRVVTGDILRGRALPGDRHAKLAQLESSAALTVGLWLTGPARAAQHAARRRRTAQ